MAEKKSNNEQFKYTYRAKCINCKKFVGPKRNKPEEADADAAEHKSKPKFINDEVKIVTTQKN